MNMAVTFDIISMFDYAFFQRAFIGGICAAVLCSLLGVFIVLKRAALIGEGVAHLSFGGIALGLFLSIYPLDTALVLSLVGIFIISYMQRKKIVYSEMAIGIMISFGLALGAVLSSLKGGFNVDLFSYLFGSILTITTEDLYVIIGLSAAVLAFALLFFKELMHMTFDEQGARLSGVPVMLFDLAFNVVLAITVVVSIKVVGSLLVSALLIIPASSAMQLSKSFRGTVSISIVLGVIAVVLGLVTSFVYDIATGGAIVMFSIVIFLLCVGLKRFIGPEELDEKADNTSS
jgi:zinc transport system permease protein